jgi:hypothetical protein
VLKKCSKDDSIPNCNQAEDLTMRICSRLCGWLVAAGICAMTFGCAEDKPEPGGIKTVSPGIPAKTGDEKPAEKPAEKPTPPPDAGSTTGGGAETPVTPKDGE